jgi:KDO II ethanolaminephosphotransferase
MFNRREGVIDGDGHRPDELLEHNVFAVFDRLGFDIDLYALQGEIGFYGKTRANFYKMREVLMSQPENNHRAAHDALLIDELRRSVERPNPQGRPRLTILHTKGSHFLYSNRYPRSFARWQPECISIETPCSKEELFNAYDNSVLYTDYFLAQVIDVLKPHRALMVYASDHGESIDEHQHFHATPRAQAPPEQRQVPIIFLGSDILRQSPALHSAWAALAQRAKQSKPLMVSHYHLFPSMLSCAGVQSPDGGINPSMDLCAQP